MSGPAMLVIADDLTGAAEIAGIGVSHGLRSCVVRCDSAGAVRDVISSPKRERGDSEPEASATEFRARQVSDADLVVVDTDTRAMEPSAAAECVRHVLRECSGRFRLFFKKIDSILRGPVGAEMQAVMAEVGKRRGLLLPQNPSKGRVIIHGEYQINGIRLDHTAFRDDPEYPRRTSRAEELVAAENVTCAEVGDTLAPAGIAIGCAATLEDVAHWASRVDADTPAVGGADFFRALLDREGYQSRDDALPDQNFDATVVVCGSASEYSRKTVANWRAAGTAVSMMSDELFASPLDESLTTRWAAEAAALVNSRRSAILAIGQEISRISPSSGTPGEGRGGGSSCDERGLETTPTLTLPRNTGGGDSAPIAPKAVLLRQSMAIVVRKLLDHVRQLRVQLFIEGGATAAAITDTMGWREFDVVGNVGPGVVAMRPLSSEIMMVIKPGSYPWGELSLAT